MAGPLLFTNNAASSLAGSISNTSTTANLASGTGILFPNPNPSLGQYFVATIRSQTNASLFEIVNVTARSGDTVTIARGGQGTTPLNWNAGDFFLKLLTAGEMNGMTQDAYLMTQIRFRLTAPLTYYADWNAGSDITGDGSTGNPFQSIQKAYTAVYQNIDAAGAPVTIVQRNGIDTGGLYITSGGILGVAGNVGFGDILTLNVTGGITTSGNAIWASQLASVNVIGSGTIQSTGAACLLATGTGQIFFEGVTIGAAATAQLFSGSGSLIQPYGAFTLQGGAPQALLVDGGQIRFDPGINPFFTVTVSGAYSPAYAFAVANNNGVIVAPSPNIYFSNSATGPRFVTFNGGGIDTSGGGPNYLAGSSAGTNNPPGWYS